MRQNIRGRDEAAALAILRTPIDVNSTWFGFNSVWCYALSFNQPRIAEALLRADFDLEAKSEPNSTFREELEQVASFDAMMGNREWSEVRDLANAVAVERSD